MTGSPMPLALRRDWQPHGRSAVPLEGGPSLEQFPRPQLVPAPPLRVTYPGSLAARLDALAHGRLEEHVRDLRARRDAALAQLHPQQRPRNSAAPLRAEPSDFRSLSNGTFAPHPLNNTATLPSSQVMMRALLRDFHRRQRQANMLVAGCLSAACALTVSGVLILASFIVPDQPAVKNPAATPEHATSIAWQRPHVEDDRSSETANRETKAHPLLVRTRAEMAMVGGGLLHRGGVTFPHDTSASDVVLTNADRELELAPLLSRRYAELILLRGLPPEAQLSAGSRNASGAWLVKGAMLGELKLQVGAAQAGDYPIDVYDMNSGNAPQGRQSFMLRVVSPSSASAAAGLNISWPAVLIDMAMMTLAAEGRSVHDHASPLQSRANALMREGDIAGARLILRHLAENGDQNAALQLAQSFDPAVLATRGVKGIGGDQQAALAWYERASRTSNDDTRESLDILANLSD